MSRWLNSPVRSSTDMTNEAILRKIKEKEENDSINDSKIIILQLRRMLHTLDAVNFKDSSFDSYVFIKRYRV